MSYMDMKPGYYEMLQPGMPWHAGTTGWTKSPFPSWGNNPNLVGPQFLAVNGLGQPPPVHAYRDGSLGAEPSARGAVLALLGIAGVFIAGAWILGGMRQKRYARNRRRKQRRNCPPGAHKHNYRRNARWTTRYKDSLPDSAFLLVERGGTKRRLGGKTYTIPRSLRKFPYKNVRGRVDLPHLRNAIARAPTADISATECRKIQKKARGILARAHEGKVRTARKAA